MDNQKRKEIEVKIREILKKHFDLEIENMDSEIFHILDSISFYRYILLLEDAFNTSITNVYDGLRSLNGMIDYLEKK